MAKQGKFVYRGDKRTVESVVRKSKQSGGAYDSYLSSEAQLLKLKEGESTIRIMPPSWAEKDDERWGDGWDIQVTMHYSVGPDNATYLCLDKMKGETCPVCEARRDATDDERDQMKPQGRFLCWAIDRDNEKAGPQVWSMPITVFREINIRSVDKKHNTPIPIDDPEEGYDVVFSREGTGIKTKYSAFEVMRDASPLHDDEKLQTRWLDYISEHPLPDILQYYDAAHIESVLFGRAERGASDDVDAPEETPVRRGARAGTGDDRDAARGGAPRRAARGRSDEDEADYLDDGAADEVDDGRSSAKGRRTRAGRTDDADEAAPDGGTRTRRRGAESAPDDDIPFEGARGRGARSSARGRAPDRDVEPDPEEEPDDADDPSAVARAKLEEMKRRRSRR